MMKVLLPLILFANLADAAEIAISWPDAVTRPWPGPELWANPAEDWVVKAGTAGRAENTFPGGNRNRPKPDFGTNGWPRGKRALALSLMKKAGAPHDTGDQHLGSTGQYGLAGFRDGPSWICTPAITSNPKTGARQ